MEIAVSLRRENCDIVQVVEDGGPGFALRETGRRSSGLGLIAALARQLRGSFAVERGRGARCIVRFPEPRLY
jgi:two-component sensor histidine kinase